MNRIWQKLAQLRADELHVRQQPGRCGAASLSIALRHYGLQVPQDQLARETHTTKDEGATPENLAAAARAHGLRAQVLEPLTLDQLQQLADADIPVIVAHQAWQRQSDSKIPWERNWRDGHYAVVMGVDDRVHLIDPATSERTVAIPLDEFLSRWHDVDEPGYPRLQLGIAVLPPATEKVGQVREFAPGIPAARRIQPIPAVGKTRPQTWEMATQLHHAERAGPHLDLRLVDKSGRAHSWAIPRGKLPGPGDRVLAIPQPTHTREYSAREGEFELPEGYGRGKVVGSGLRPVEVVRSGPGSLRWNVYGGPSEGNQEYQLVKTPRGALLQNLTATPESVRGQGPVPQSKPKYKELQAEKVEFGDPREIHQAKVDGAHVTFHLLPGQHPVKVFSYRPTERATGVLEHTHKLPRYRELQAPQELAGTVLRGELYAADKATGRALPAEQVGGLLNASVWRSREKQQELGAELRPVVFDVVRYRGQPMEDAPYEQKLKVLQEVQRRIPRLRLPPTARTPEEKQRLFQRIQAGEEPITNEGIISWSLDSPQPTKAKFRPDVDAEIVGVTAGRGKHSGRVGALQVRLPGKDAITNVGTGLSDEQRQQLAQNPDDYIGRVIKVRTQQVFPSGRLRAPSFAGFHLEKGKIASLYHGSPERIGQLRPRQEHGDPRVPAAVFATPDPTFALAYAGKKWGDRDINQEIRGGPKARMILREMRPGALQEIYGGRTGYIHHLPSESFEALPGRRTTKEVVSKTAVTPSKIEEVGDVLARLRSTPNVELETYDPQSRFMRTALKRQVSRMLEMTPEDQEGYKKWRLEVAPTEVRQMWEEEVSRRKQGQLEKRGQRIELPPPSMPENLKSLKNVGPEEHEQRQLAGWGYSMPVGHVEPPKVPGLDVKDELQDEPDIEAAGEQSDEGVKAAPDEPGVFTERVGSKTLRWRKHPSLLSPETRARAREQAVQQAAEEVKPPEIKPPPAPDDLKPDTPDAPEKPQQPKMPSAVGAEKMIGPKLAQALMREMEKDAASIAQLRQAARRIGRTANPGGAAGDIFHLMGAAATPTVAQTRRGLKMGPHAMMSMIPQEMGEVMEEYAKRAPGRVHVRRGVGRVLNPAIKRKAQEATDLRTLATVHEGLERGVKPKEMQWSSLHLSPKVMVEEQNMLNRLQGGQQAGQSLREIREAGGETGLLRQQFQETFKDPRAQEFLQPGARVPRAMKKRFMRQQHTPLTESQAQEMATGTAGHLMKKQIEATGAGRVTGVFKEAQAELLGLGARTAVALGQRALEQPGKLLPILGFREQYRKGRLRHAETMEALRRGYPAGWVALGMRPQE